MGGRRRADDPCRAGGGGSTVKETKTDKIRTVRLLEPLERDLALWRETVGGGKRAGWFPDRARHGLD